MVSDIFERKVKYDRMTNGIFVTFRGVRWVPTGEESVFKVGAWVNVTEFVMENGAWNNIIVWACGQRETWRKA
jgi:hypothetical protein